MGISSFKSEVKSTQYFHMFYGFKGKLSHNFPKQILGIFHSFSHQGSCCTLTSFNSISEPYNQLCALGEINECYEVLCNVCIKVCMCLKVSVNYSQLVRVYDFSPHKIERVNMALGILNLEGHHNGMIGSKVTTILPPLFFFFFFFFF